MFLTELFQKFYDHALQCRGSLVVTIPLIALIWSIDYPVTLFAEKGKLPQTKQDFIALKYDLTEFALMNVLVIAVFVAQVALVNIVLSLLGVRVYQRTCWSRL